MLGTGRHSLRSSSSSRETSPQDAASLEQWQVFSREEGRKAAELFMEHLGGYMTDNGDVSESKCVREFARTLMDHLARYQTQTTLATVIANSRPARTKPQWWQIFKRAKSLRKRSEASSPEGAGIILDGVVQQMDLQDGAGEGSMGWSKCRLVLANCQENYQLMIYTPPKASKPKLSLFCFLIEEVRTASLLEVPDSTSAFVVKSSSHGDYVFDVSTETDKQQWMSKILQYCPSLSSSSNGHIPMSYSLNAISESKGRSKLPRSRSQTPVPRAVSPFADRTTPPHSHSRHNAQSMFLDHAQNNATPTSESFTRNTVSYRRPRQVIQHSPSPSPGSGPSPRTTSPTQQDPSPIPQGPSPIPPSPSPIPPRDHDTNLLHSTVATGSTQSADNMLTTPSVPPITRKSSAPAAVHHTTTPSTSNGGNGDRALFGSSEALGRVGSEEHLSSITIPVVTEGRSHSRQRSYDSSVSHTTDAPTSPLARNCYRIEVGSSERINTNTSGRSSAFSSAGNLHEVIRDQGLVMSPLEDNLSQISNPLYIETNSDVGRQRSWANTSIDVDNLRTLSQYHWFHGMITRSIASMLTQQHGTLGNGQFLVRQSESRDGDFVLTFNSHGNAKHLRFTIDADGCTIQHLWFEDGPTMIEYFKTHPIPLDSPGSDDVILTDYIDRSYSDTIRTTTVINMDRIQRTPPRRSRSLHGAMTRSTGANEGASPTPPRTGNIRQFFNRQRSSSSQSIRSRVTVQRTHSANAGSLQEMSTATGRGGSRAGRWSRENNYVGTNY